MAARQSLPHFDHSATASLVVGILTRYAISQKCKIPRHQQNYLIDYHTNYFFITNVMLSYNEKICAY